ncbi:MAG: hypothetical protein OEZ29_02665 [Candidatus Bathyarchaeota archaeon]|nr:hypothetical protein [Candidatus Bathyarchaeota archaeon]MDH5779479.1 hypothetical protein [Candidatus Bathyarchaeota archaeon]
MNSDKKPVAAFMLSLMAGIFIILGGSVWCLWLDGHWDMGWMEGMMHGWEEHTHSWGLEGTISYTMGLLGIIFGVIVVILAIMLYLSPLQHQLWGALIIVFSVMSVLSCMGSMGIGLLLGIIGGVLAILWKPGTE